MPFRFDYFKTSFTHKSPATYTHEAEYDEKEIVLDIVIELDETYGVIATDFNMVLGTKQEDKLNHDLTNYIQKRWNKYFDGVYESIVKTKTGFTFVHEDGNKGVHINIEQITEAVEESLEKIEL